MQTQEALNYEAIDLFQHYLAEASGVPKADGKW